MKINVLTYWGVANFGAWAQAYALNKVLNSLFGEIAEIKHIAYLEKSHWDMYYKTDSRLENAFFYSWDRIPHTKWMTEEQLEEQEFEILIIGSDAVWEFNPAFNDDYHMFAKNLKAERIISYAASFGNLSIDEAERNIRLEDFERFNFISVRDNNSAAIVNSISNKICMPICVLDPTLVWNFSADKNIIQPRFSNYILVYGVSWDEEFKDKAVKYAREHNLKLISAGFINDWCDMNLKLIELRTVEWIGLFAKASMVFTSTFHGLMLSLNYKKQVKFSQVGYVKNRSETLIENLNIKNSITQFDAEIDYEEVNLKLSRLRELSIQFLKESIVSDK